MSPDKIRVLYLVDNLSFGGGERGCGQLSTGLNRDRFQTCLAAHPGGKLEEIVRQGGIQFFPLDMSRKFNFTTWRQLRGLISENGINIVHSEGMRADFLARLACRNIPSTAVICTVAMLIEGYDVSPLKKIVYKIADRFSSRYVTHYIAVSKALKQRLVGELGIPADRVSVIYNGVELDQYNPNLYTSDDARRSLGIPDGGPLVGTIGRLVYQKNFSCFLKAAHHVHLKRKQVKFVIVGHGEEESHLKSLAESLGISQVCTFAGLRFDTAKVLSALDIFVLPSILEGLPRIVIEAMAMERPIVATDIDGVREELRHDETGLLVPPADPAALAEAILSLLDNQEKARRLGRAARKDAEQRFNLERTLMDVETLYEKLRLSIPVQDENLR